MVAYYFSFKTALVKGSPNVVSPNTSVLIYDVTDPARQTPVTAYADTGLTVIKNLVTDQYGIVPDFYTNNLPDVLWKSGAFEGQWATSQSRPGIRGATGPEGPQGVQGVQGNPGLNGAGTNADVAAYIPSSGPTRDALDARYATGVALSGKVNKGELLINVKDYGAKGDGAADDTAAIQTAINAATPGTTIYFPPASSGYIITAGLTITTPNLRFSVGSRDYGTHMKCTVPGVTMLTVKASQFINELTFVGDGGIRGVGSTVTGIDMFGDASANQDCTIGGTFIYLAMPLKLRGRNADVEGASFSNSLAGVQLDGPDPVYHTGAPADGDKRGNQIRGCRFHDVTGKAIELTATAKVVHAIIEGNFFDSNSPTQAIAATGTAAAPHNRLTILGNKITESSADAISLTYCINSTIRGNEIYGLAFTTGGRGIVLANCNDIEVSDTMITQVSRSAVVGTNNARVRVNNVKVLAIGADTTTTAHGFDFNSTNSDCEFADISVVNTDGWGFTGDPATSSLTGGRFAICTLGTINSATVHNRATSGRNVYVEGAGGRKQDYASKPFDLTVAAGATALATITSTNAFSSFEVEVKVVGRNAAGNVYARYVRYVRPENGTPVYFTPIGDVAQGTITITFGTSGNSGVTAFATVTGSDAFVTAHVTAYSGGGINGTATRGVTVAMA